MGLKAALTLMLVSGLLAAPSWNSQPGTMRVMSAFGDGKGYLGVNLFHLNMLGLSSDIDTTSKTAIDIYTGLAIGLSRKITLSARIPYLYDKYGDSTASSIGDLEAGFKVTLVEGEKAAFGFFPFLSISTGAKDKGLNRPFGTGTLDYGLLALFSLKPSDKVLLNFNLGGFNRYQDESHNAVADLAIAGFSAFFNLGKVNPFFEISHENFASQLVWDVDKKLYGGNPLRIGGGLNFALGALNFDLGGSYYLSKRRVDDQLADSVYYMLPREDIKYEVSLGLSFEKKAPVVTTGLIAGVITDAETGNPLENAHIKVTELGLKATSDLKGAFSLEDVPAGLYTVEVTRTGYEPFTAHLMVKAGKTSQVQYSLKKKVVEKATVKGKVMDRATGKPVVAVLSVEGVGEIRTNSDGTYTFTAKPGTYTMKVRAEGYEPATKRFTLKAKEVRTIDVGLVKTTPTLTFPIIHFDCCSYRIKSKYAKMLDEVIRTLTKYPTVKVVIEGHASADGPEDYNMRLSIKRAEAVRKYLEKGGISADRLQVKGYGEAKPIASNDTLEGRRKNRRVEIKVLK